MPHHDESNSRDLSGIFACIRESYVSLVEERQKGRISADQFAKAFTESQQVLISLKLLSKEVHLESEETKNRTAEKRKEYSRLALLGQNNFYAISHLQSEIDACYGVQSSHVKLQLESLDSRDITHNEHQDTIKHLKNEQNNRKKLEEECSILSQQVEEERLRHSLDVMHDELRPVALGQISKICETELHDVFGYDEPGFKRDWEAAQLLAAALRVVKYRISKAGLGSVSIDNGSVLWRLPWKDSRLSTTIPPHASIILRISAASPLHARLQVALETDSEPPLDAALYSDAILSSLYLVQVTEMHEAFDWFSALTTLVAPPQPPLQSGGVVTVPYPTLPTVAQRVIERTSVFFWLQQRVPVLFAPKPLRDLRALTVIHCQPLAENSDQAASALPSLEGPVLLAFQLKLQSSKHQQSWSVTVAVPVYYPAAAPMWKFEQEDLSPGRELAALLNVQVPQAVARRDDEESKCSIDLLEQQWQSLCNYAETGKLM